MRPPQNAGEDEGRLRCAGAGDAASMRPPQNAGEDRRVSAKELRKRLASMRPPQNAGEDPRSGRGPRVRCNGFNEAPAERGGRPLPPALAGWRMRLLQ